MPNEINEGEASVQTPEEKQKDLKEKVTKTNKAQLEESIKFKAPILEKKKNHINLYHGRFTKKMRSMFNVSLPVMAGMVDTMLSSWDEPIQLRFEENHPADYLAATKVQALWDLEKVSTDVNSKWDYKIRVDKRNAIFFGVGIPMYYAESDPKYKSVFSVINFEDFHFQPTGGGQIENHLFSGREGIQKTKEQLLNNKSYDQEGVKKIIEKYGDTSFLSTLDDGGENDKLARFRAVGLDVNSNNYVGQPVFNLVEWISAYKGKRYYNLFEPTTCTSIRFCPLKEIIPSERYPWRPWHTHEDQKNFITKSYSDDMYPVCDSIITLFNQELTNREKANFHARAYDEEMFPDVQKLDSASYRPDALVPFDSKNGTRKIGDGLYEFQVGELQGTINLIDWVNQTTGKSIGVTDLSQGNVHGKPKQASVVFAEQQNSSKRFSYQSQSWTEAFGEIGSLYVELLKENMPAKMAIKRIGEAGYEWDYLKRSDLNTEDDFNIKVISSTADMAASKAKADKQMATLMQLIQSPNINSKARDEELLRVAGFEDDRITKLMDTQNYGNKEMSARASLAIEEFLNDKTPKLYYGADVSFMQKIVDFATDHRDELGVDKYTKIMDYVQAHAQFVQANMKRKANMIKSGQMNPNDANGQDQGNTSNQTLTAQGQAAPAMPTAPQAPGQGNVPTM